MKHQDTQFLRFIAILLIINSHLDKYYPIQSIASGGAIGNAIFFFLSAFGIYISQQKRNRNFDEWILGRIKRIYPTIWVTVILLLMPVMLINGDLSSKNILQFIGNFFYPPYWFIQALLVFYIITFPLLKSIKKQKELILFGVLFLIYLGSYLTWIDMSKWSIEKIPFVIINYFIIFIFGIFIARRNDKIIYSGIMNYIWLFLFVGLIYLHKYFITKGILIEFQFVQQAALYPMLYYLLKISRSPFVLSILMNNKSFSRIVNFIANITLEIYIVHETIILYVLKAKLPFPLNLIVLLTLTFTLAILVKKLSDLIIAKMFTPNKLVTIT